MTKKARGKNERERDLLSMALAARRKPVTSSKAPPPDPPRVPTAEEDARGDYLSSLSVEALKRLRRLAVEFQELKEAGRLYNKPPAALPPDPPPDKK